LDQHWNFFAALFLVLALGGLIGATIELGVMRRLFKAPRAIVLVATIGVSQLVFVAQLLLPKIHQPGRYPSPIDRTLDLGSLLLRALAAGLFGGLMSVSWALAGGVIIGVGEAIVFANVRNPGVADAVLFALVLVLVLLRVGRSAQEEGGWSLTPRVAALPERL